LKPAAGEDGVDAVAVLALQVIAVHSMVGLEVADHRLDGGAALHSRGPQVLAWRLDSVARVAGGLRLAGSRIASTRIADTRWHGRWPPPSP
jgi:hypothetical protein